jgi:effector-binding domain-containing protein
LSEREEKMERKVELKEVPVQPVLGMRVKTNLEKVGEDMGNAFQQIMPYMGEAGVFPTGPPFALFYYEGEFDPNHIDMEICMPVNHVVESKGDVEGKEDPGGTMASIMHIGPYSGVEPAYNAIDAWVKENGYSYAGPAREVYLNDPSQVEEKDLQTEILMPVTK